MGSEFTTSVNIIRDSDRELSYFPTANARQVASQLVNDFHKGNRSFNIIGSYGTGKSSFLMALENSVCGRKQFFNINFLANPRVEFIKIIGSYTSIIDSFLEKLEIPSAKNEVEDILMEIYQKYHSLGKRNSLLFIVIDEFGKFLEYASKYNPEKELYFLQQLAEFCNNPKHRIVLLTTVHQSFESYAYSLSPSQKQEWIKVKGRFRELTFNEPVEQLLFLAAEFNSSNTEFRPNKKAISGTHKLFSETTMFQVNPQFTCAFLEKLFPLDIFAAHVLAYSLQKYGQNERSLFTFLESADFTGLIRFKRNEYPFYNLSCVFDYLNTNFYSYLISKYNPDFSAWSNIRSSIEKIERIFENDLNQYCDVVKTIGLLNLFAPAGSVIDENFLVSYLSSTTGHSNSSQLIKNLSSKQIIRYRSHSKRFILFEGTDLDIQAALVDAGNRVSEVFDVVGQINKYFNFSPVMAKRITFEKGTPRFFEFVISDYPIDVIPQGEIDGYVNLIFNPKLKISEIQAFSSSQKEAIIYCYFKNSAELKDILFEIEKLQKVIQDNGDDRVAKRELESIISSHINILNHYIKERGLFSESNSTRWFFGESEYLINSKADFNKLLSEVCQQVYSSTPIFKNELVNKHRISTSIRSAKKNYFKALLNSWDLPDLGFESKKFPPEKSIYLSLLKENGLASGELKSSVELQIKNNSSFAKLWKASIKFLNSAKSQKVFVADFYQVLSEKPFKLKQGFLDFWIPTFLFLKRDEFAIFNEDIYITSINEENLELIAKYPKKYSIKTFDVSGIKLDLFNSYRAFLNQQSELKFDNSVFIETIKPFLQFYRGLSHYSKTTNRLSSEAVGIRKAIALSKDPEATFFVDFPLALGFSIGTIHEDHVSLIDFASKLQASIREIRGSFDALVVRFETFLCEDVLGQTMDFIQYKSSLQHRYSGTKRHLLLPNQRTFLLRLDSAIEDKQSWLNSLAQVLMNKTMENFEDADEILLYDRFQKMVLDLDSLSSLSKVESDDTAEEVLAVKIDTFFSSINPKIVRFPKNKAHEIDYAKAKIVTQLGKDRIVNIAAVVRVLKDLLN
jgi:hypothetical protein